MTRHDGPDPVRARASMGKQPSETMNNQEAKTQTQYTGATPLPRNTRETLTALGLPIIGTADREERWGSLSGKKCYGKVLERPTHMGVDGLLKASGEAPEAKLVDPNAEYGDEDWSEDSDRYSRVPWRKDSRIVEVDGVAQAMVSKRFTLHQHGQMQEDLAAALQEMGVDKTASRIEYRREGSQMVAHIFVPRLSQEIRLLEDTGENILLGYKLSNAHDGSGSAKLEAFGVNTICINYQAWGQDKWSVSIPHSRLKGPADWQEALENFRDDLRELPATIQAAKEVWLPVEDIAPILVGAGIPENYVVGGKRGHAADIPPIADQPWVYGNGLPTGATRLTAWDLYQAGTALATHAMDVSPAAAEKAARDVSKVLDGSEELMQLAEAGRKKLGEKED